MVKPTFLALILSLLFSLSVLTVQAEKTTSSLSRIGFLPPVGTQFTYPKYQPGSALWQLILIKEIWTNVPSAVRLQKRIDELILHHDNLHYQQWERQIKEIAKIINNPQVETNSQANYLLTKIYLSQILYHSRTELTAAIDASTLNVSQKKGIKDQLLEASNLQRLSPDQVEKIFSKQSVFYKTMSLDQGQYTLELSGPAAEHYVWLMLYIDHQNQIIAENITPNNSFSLPSFEALFVATYQLSDPIKYYPEPWLELNQVTREFTDQSRIFGSNRKYLFIEIVLVPVLLASFIELPWSRQKAKIVINDATFIIVTMLLMSTIIFKSSYSNMVLNVLGGLGILLLLVPVLLLKSSHSFTKKQSKSTKKPSS